MRTQLSALLAIGFIAGGSIRAAQQADTYRPIATIQDIMNTMIYPSSDYIRQSTATDFRAGVASQREPKNDTEWNQLRNQTVVLIEATNLLAMPGRRVAKPGDKLRVANAQTMTPEEIESLINIDRLSFTNFARLLQDASVKMLAASDGKDLSDALQAGSAILAACENCHMRFWYASSTRRPQSRP